MLGYVSGNHYHAVIGGSTWKGPLIPQHFQPALHEDRAGSGSQSEPLCKEMRVLAVGSWQWRRPGECASICNEAVYLGENFWVIGQARIQPYQILPNSFLPCRTNLHSHQQPRGVLISLPALGIERLLYLSHFGGCIMFQICNS